MTENNIILKLVKKWKHSCGGIVGGYNFCNSCIERDNCENIFSELKRKLRKKLK